VTNLSPGGMITPGWLALILVDTPKLVIVIAVVVVLAYIGTRILERFVILYGKRLFATVVLVAVFLQITAVLFVLKQFPKEFDETTLGFIVPGLIAYQLIRQPIGATLISTTSVMSLSYVIVLIGVKLNLIQTAAGVAAERLDVPTPSVFVLVLLGIAVIGGFTYLGVSLRRVPRMPDSGGPPV
jgi:poly-gamma-glutamate biosynthesis protein PgsC/CapC